MTIKLPVKLEGKHIIDADGMIVAMATCLTGDDTNGERSVEEAFAIAAEIVEKLNAGYHPVTPENEATSGLTLAMSFRDHVTNFHDGDRIGYTEALILRLTAQQKLEDPVPLRTRRGTIRHRVPGSDYYSVAWDDHHSGLYGYEHGLGLVRIEADNTKT